MKPKFFSSRKRAASAESLVRTAPPSKVWKSFVPIFVEDVFGLSRDELWVHLWDRGVQTRRYFYPGAHLCEPYCSEMPWFKDLLPVTRLARETILCLPCYYDLSDLQAARVCGAIAEARKNAHTIKAWYKKLLRATPAPKHLVPLVQALRRGNSP